MRHPDISIFVRAHNESDFIGQCLQAIASQSHSYSIEVLVLDSASTDATAEIARQHGATVYTIPKDFFGFATALNAGMLLAKGRFFVTLSAHCIPCNDHWLTELIRPLIDDTTCAASFSRHLPWPDASLPEVFQNKATFPLKDIHITPETWRLAIDEGKEPYTIAFLSNTAAAYTREVALQFPFKNVRASEDRLLAVDLLTAGYAIHYAARSEAYHLHPPDLREFRKVAFLNTSQRSVINQYAYNLLNKSVRYSPPSLLLARAKIILYVLWLSIALWIPLFPGRKNRVREFKWRVASLGTTIGKYEGVLAARNNNAPHVLLPGSPDKILAHLGHTS